MIILNEALQHKRIINITPINEATSKSNFKIIKGKYYIEIQSDKKIHNIPVCIDNSFKSDTDKTDEEILSTIDIDKFEQDFKVFKSSFNGIEKKINEYIEQTCIDWDEEYNSLKKYIFMDYIDYCVFNNGETIFTIWYNNESHNGARYNVLGGHSITFEIKIINGKAIPAKGISLNG